MKDLEFYVQIWRKINTTEVKQIRGARIVNGSISLEHLL